MPGEQREQQPGPAAQGVALGKVFLGTVKAAVLEVQGGHGLGLSAQGACGRNTCLRILGINVIIRAHGPARCRVLRQDPLNHGFNLGNRQILAAGAGFMRWCSVFALLGQLVIVGTSVCRCVGHILLIDAYPQA